MAALFVGDKNYFHCSDHHRRPASPRTRSNATTPARTLQRTCARPKPPASCCGKWAGSPRHRLNRPDRPPPQGQGQRASFSICAHSAAARRRCMGV